jgi:hypothetical protein
VWHGDIIRLVCSWQKITEAVAQTRNAVWNAGKFTKNQSLFLKIVFRNERCWDGDRAWDSVLDKKGRAVVTTAALLKMICINLMKT